MTSVLPIGRNGRLLHEVASMLGNRVIAFGLALAIASLRGHTLGAEAFGVFSVAVLLPTLLATILNMGISISAVYYIARGEVGARQALRSNLGVSMATSLLGMTVGGLLVGYCGHWLFPNVSPAVLWIAIAYFPMLLLRTNLAGLLQATEDFRAYRCLLTLELLSTLAFTIIVFQLLDPTPESTLLAFCLGTFVAVIASYWAARKHLAVDTRPHMPGYTAKSLHFGWKANLANLLAFLNYRQDIVLVNLFVGPVETGIYAATLVLAERLWILSQSVSTVLFPRLASLHEVPDQAHEMTERVSRVVLVFTTVVSVGVAAFACPLLSMIYGEDFGVGATALLLLLPGFILASWARMLTNSLAAAGHVGWNAITAGIIVVVNVVANLILIPRYAICGASIASSLGWLVYSAVVAVLYARLHARTWWHAALPRHADWHDLRRESRQALHAIHHAIQPVATRATHFLAASAPARITVCALAGLMLTAYLEIPETECVRPIRNLIMLGALHERGDSPFSATTYKDGHGVNPVHVAQSVRPQVLSILADVERGKDVRRTGEHDLLIRVADYFVAKGKPCECSGVAFRVWSYEFDYPFYEIDAPWHSGMAQGHVMELMLAAHRLTGNSLYLNTAKEAASALAVPIEQGGVAVTAGAGIWFEEYASTSCRPPEVLNGHNFALNGLWHLSQLDPAYRTLFDEGVAAVKQRLTRFDHGVWSHYDLVGTPANRKYQTIHVEQMRELYARTGDPLFNAYATKFAWQLRLPFHVAYRLFVYPTRILVVLVTANTLAIWLLVELMRLMLIRKSRLKIYPYEPNFEPGMLIHPAA
jgi:O-antigen/teichoic acid export membrane protein